MNKYVHGYSDNESNRLHDQANSLADLLHYDSVWEEGSIILEAGCGIGAQTKIIATKKQVSSFALDPKLETADIDLQNNHWPRKMIQSKFELYKSKTLSRG